MDGVACLRYCLVKGRAEKGEVRRTSVLCVEARAGYRRLRPSDHFVLVAGKEEVKRRGVRQGGVLCLSVGVSLKGRTEQRKR